MKLIKKFLILSGIFFSILIWGGDAFQQQAKGCGSASSKGIIYGWEKKRKALLECSDMVLLYGGGSHRNYQWNDELIAPYVTYVDKSGREQWMFDSFLLLEIKDGNGVSFATGYTKFSADQSDWKKLADYFFQPDYVLGALNTSIDKAKKRIGKPLKKHQVVIGIPEPLKKQTSWGMIDGKMIDCSITADRIEAVKWYVDYVRMKFDEMKFNNLELAGFYWIAEEASNSKTITAGISEYLNSMHYGFYWIPYFNSPGFTTWKALNFNYAYLQPNYFFKEPLIESRLDDACKKGAELNMGMELEFDDRILTKNKAWHYRLYNYMEAFKKHGVWETKRIAYYQGGRALYQLSVSNDSTDQAMYNDFCKFVVDRPIRKIAKKIIKK